MSHPTREQWTDYVYGECEPAEATRLAEHLDACPECRQAVESWRSVMGKLEAYEVTQPARRRAWLPRLARWAAAAAVLIALGYGLGRATAPDAQELLAQIEPAMRAQWQSELAAARKDIGREAEERAALTLNAAHSAAASLIAEYVQAFDSVRRSDLQALATVTDQELRRTRWQLAAAVARAEMAPPAGVAPSDSPTEEGGKEG